MINKGICPICGSENNCNMVKGLDASACWCMEIEIPKALLEKLTDDQKKQGCICKNCVDAYVAGINRFS